MHIGGPAQSPKLNLLQCHRSVYMGRGQTEFYHQWTSLNDWEVTAMEVFRGLLLRRLGVAPLHLNHPRSATRARPACSPVCRPDLPRNALPPRPQPASPRDSNIRVTIVNRLDGRRIVNVAFLVKVLRNRLEERYPHHKVTVRTVELELLHVSEQVDILYKSDIFVHFWGGASAFMPLLSDKTTTVVLFAAEQFEKAFASLWKRSARGPTAKWTNLDTGRMRFPDAEHLRLEDLQPPLTSENMSLTKELLKRLGRLSRNDDVRDTLKHLTELHPFFGAPCYGPSSLPCYRFW